MWRGLIRRPLANTKITESGNLSRNVLSGEPEQRHHKQSCLPPTSLALTATGSIGLRLVSSVITEHASSNSTSNTWLRLVVVSNDRLTTASSELRWRGVIVSELTGCLSLCLCNDRISLDHIVFCWTHWTLSLALYKDHPLFTKIDWPHISDHHKFPVIHHSWKGNSEINIQINLETNLPLTEIQMYFRLLMVYGNDSNTFAAILLINLCE